jgi:hypothetical protein
MATGTAPATTPIVAPTATLGDLAAIMADLTREHPEAGARVQHAAFHAIMGHAESDTGTGWWVASERDVRVQYLVLPAHQSCTCQDAARHGSLSPCKHLLCVETIARLERIEAGRTDPTPPPSPEHGVGCGCTETPCRDTLDYAADAPGPYWLTEAAYAALGELPDLTPQCPRCGSESTILSHIDHLGAHCLSAELFGGDAA